MTRSFAAAVGLVIVASVAVVAAKASFASPASSVADGPYVLEITAPRTIFAIGEPITGITAALTYHGSEASVRIGHAHLTPLGFGIQEPVNGWNLSPAWLQSCEMSDLARGVPLTNPFGKSGGSLRPDPAFTAFMEDPVLRLPPGTWHVYAEASFDEGNCGGTSHDIKATITIVVQ